MNQAHIIPTKGSRDCLVQKYAEWNGDFFDVKKLNRFLKLHYLSLKRKASSSAHWNVRSFKRG